MKPRIAARSSPIVFLNELLWQLLPRDICNELHALANLAPTLLGADANKVIPGAQTGRAGTPCPAQPLGTARLPKASQREPLRGGGGAAHGLQLGQFARCRGRVLQPGRP
jgi:hypothetical protein